MKILVTGVSGFIGQHVCRKLAKNGFEVLRVVRPGRGTDGSSSQNHADTSIFAVDLYEPKALEASLTIVPNLVVHIAASIPDSFLGPDAAKAAAINRVIDENVFMACKMFGVGAVYTSTTSVYGLSRGSVKTETSPVQPIGPYAAGKLAGERLGEELLARRNLPFTVLRINAPYGPGQNRRTVLRLFIERAIAGNPVRYHGSGSREQDFTFIGDIADAVVSAVERNGSGLYNISGGEPISMRELARLVVRCVPGSRSTVEKSGEDDPQESLGARFSIEKAKAQLGWFPRVSIESGVRVWVNSLLHTRHEDRASI